MLQVVSICSTDRVTLYLAEKPVIFRMDVLLECQTSNESVYLDTQRRWFMGKTEDNLIVNGVSVDNSKYNELVGPHLSYILRITSFEESDLDIYGCSYVLLRTTINLTLNENDYEYHPKDTEMTVHATRNYGNLHVEVLFTKVYPLPICSFTYIDEWNSKDLSGMVVSTSWKSVNFYSTQKILDDIPVGRLAATLNITCRIGTSHMHILSEKFSNEYNSADGDGSGSDLVICTLVINMIIVICLLPYIYFRTRLHDKCHCKRLMKQQARRCSTTNEQLMESSVKVKVGNDTNGTNIRTTNNTDIKITSVMGSLNDQHTII